jgi:hypothetical protein
MITTTFSKQKCYNPNCSAYVAINKNGKTLSACKKHLKEFYTKCILCIKNDRATDNKTQRLMLFCTKCYTDNYLKRNISSTEPKKCDRCKTNFCSSDHRICLTCRRIWRTLCIICRKNNRLPNNQYHCKKCYTEYQKYGCKAHIWINNTVGRKQCWSIAESGEYCKRCKDYGICAETNCHNISSQEYCTECQTERKEITNEININTIRLIDCRSCIACKDIDRLPGDLYCGRYICLN